MPIDAQARKVLPVFAAFALLVPGAGSFAASTSDLAREQRWASQVVDTLIAGEAVWLEAGGVKFLGLYVRPDRPRPGAPAVVLLHGRGVHPAWGFIDNLRLDLADRGWHTLSLQLPVLHTDARLSDYSKTFPEAFDRVDAGIGYLRKQGLSDVVLIGHSSGAMTAVAYAAERRVAALASVVAIGLSTDPTGARFMRPAVLLEKISLPVLDIYGAEDIPEVLNHTAARAAAAKKAGNARYVQHREAGANHFFTDRYDRLRKRVVRWLEQRR